MRIESVSEKADRAGQYYVKLSDGRTLRLYPQTLGEFNLYQGRELEEEELTRLRQSAGAVSAKMRAVRIVSASAVSARDLESRLRHKGENPEDAREAVAWMQELQLVDDLDTAKQLVRRGVSRGYGKNRLRQMLYEKRIPKEFWDEVLEDYPDQTESISAYLTEHLDETSDRREIKRVVDALIRKGHSYGTIQKCLRQMDFDGSEAREEWL